MFNSKYLWVFQSSLLLIFSFIWQGQRSYWYDFSLLVLSFWGVEHTTSSIKCSMCVKEDCVFCCCQIVFCTCLSCSFWSTLFKSATSLLILSLEQNIKVLNYINCGLFLLRDQWGFFFPLSFLLSVPLNPPTQLSMYLSFYLLTFPFIQLPTLPFIHQCTHVPIQAPT